jgi:nitrogen fixation protein
MSKISSYSLADEPLQLSDRLIGTEAPRPTPSATPLATKNFSLGELLQLFSSEFPAASLQAVLDTGNTATQNITLTGTITTSVIKPDEIEDVLGSQGTTFQFLSKAAGGVNWVDLPIVYPTLDEVLAEGDTSQRFAKVGRIYLFDEMFTVYSFISVKNRRFIFTDDLGKQYVHIFQNTISLIDSTSLYSFNIKKPTTLSNNHTAFFQDTSGTVAYLQDIPDEIELTTVGSSGPATLIGSTLNIPNYSGGSATVPTLDEVLNEGNYSELSAFVGGIGLYDSSILEYYGIVANDEMFLFKNNLGSNIFTVGYSEFSLYNGTGAIAANFSSALLTSTRNFQFPNASGTIALISNIPSLSGYVPYTGATTNLDLGEYEVKAGQMTLDTTPTGVASIGTTQWNNTIGSSQTLLKGGSVILKNGVDLVARVVNKVTPNATLTKAAYQAVRISGAQGQRLAVAYAQANNDNNSADTIGLVCETIPTNQEGFILTVGQLEGINTTGSLQGETWNDGDVIYLSPTTPGALTKVKPTAPGHIVIIGYVEYAHAVHGKIYVKIMNGWELDELHNVKITSPQNNDRLVYNSTLNIWENKPQNIFLNTINNSVTGTSIETVISSNFAPANSLTNDSIVYFNSMIYRNVRTGIASYRVYVNTSNSLVGATNIAVFTISANTGFLQLDRYMLLKNNLLSGISITASSPTSTTTTAIKQDYSYNPTNGYYWIVTAQLNVSTDNIFHQYSFLREF